MVEEVDIPTDLDSDEWVDGVDRFSVGGILMARVSVVCEASFIISCLRGVGFWKRGGIPVGRLGGVPLFGGRVLAWIIIASSGRCRPIAQLSGSDHVKLS